LLAQLDTLLAEAVDVPEYSLDEHLVLVQRDFSQAGQAVGEVVFIERIQPGT
jgi:hypothetical protein